MPKEKKLDEGMFTGIKDCGNCGVKVCGMRWCVSKNVCDDWRALSEEQAEMRAKRVVKAGEVGKPEEVLDKCKMDEIINRSVRRLEELKKQYERNCDAVCEDADREIQQLEVEKGLVDDGTDGGSDGGSDGGVDKKFDKKFDEKFDEKVDKPRDETLKKAEHHLTTDELDAKLNNAYHAGIDWGMRVVSRYVLGKAVLEFRMGKIDRAEDFRILADYIVGGFIEVESNRIYSELLTGTKKQS